ncbi:hypothetical protein D0T08_03435 [Emticicia sp. C21]|nr:hypothetical protein D0T08_03435 [Emticicia sp. C21]
MAGTFLNEESVKVSTTKTEPKKVTNMVGTFLNEKSVKGPSTKTQPKKVANMVGTFFNRSISMVFNR